MNQERLEEDTCPLDGGGPTDVNGMGVTITGERVKRKNKVQCAIKMLQRQFGLKAGYVHCGDCEIDVSAGTFSGSLESTSKCVETHDDLQ